MLGFFMYKCEIKTQPIGSLIAIFIGSQAVIFEFHLLSQIRSSGFTASHLTTVKT